MSKSQEFQNKLRVGLLYGGKNAEHEVSVQSARSVFTALDKEKFEPLLIGIDKTGAWQVQEPAVLLAGRVAPASIDDSTKKHLPTHLPGNYEMTMAVQQKLDVIFPVLHGPLGEDGAVQGLLEMAGLPYVGSGVLGSAIGMDKDITKRLLRQAGLPITDYIVLCPTDSFDAAALLEQLGVPVFVKPANMGSSVGVNKAATARELEQAIIFARQYDRKVLVEKAVIGDEVECACLGNDEIAVSLPGRIIYQDKFYTYDAKYQEDVGTSVEVPANLPPQLTEKVQATARRTYQTLACEGVARVDMFVTKAGEVLVNEVNTLPGFTKTSVYPQLWAASGIEYTQLITRLIELALERAQTKGRLLTSRTNLA